MKQEKENVRFKLEKKNTLWKDKIEKSMKNGTRNTIYWVKPQHKHEDGTLLKNTKWRTSTTYNGCWKNNKKDGFGVQIYGNGSKYEGMWENNMRHGSGTLWVTYKKNKALRKLYTGDWAYDKMEGKGTMYFDNGDKYEGMWKANQRFGKGKLLYNNGDLYVGQWNLDTRCGYGCLFKASGDQFEGMWLNNEREGRGSYFFKNTNKIIVGEWINDNPKCVIYCDINTSKQIKNDIDHHLKIKDQNLIKSIDDEPDSNPIEIYNEINQSNFLGNQPQKKKRLTFFEEIQISTMKSYDNNIQNDISYKTESKNITKNDDSLKNEFYHSNISVKDKNNDSESANKNIPDLLLESPIQVLVDQIDLIRRSRRLFRIKKMPVNMMFSSEQFGWLEKEFRKVEEDDKTVGFWKFLNLLKRVDPELDYKICVNAIKSIFSDVDLDELINSQVVSFKMNDNILNTKQQNLLQENNVHKFWKNFYQLKNGNFFNL